MHSDESFVYIYRCSGLAPGEQLLFLVEERSAALAARKLGLQKGIPHIPNPDDMEIFPGSYESGLDWHEHGVRMFQYDVSGPDTRTVALFDLALTMLNLEQRVTLLDVIRMWDQAKKEGRDGAGTQA